MISVNERNILKNPTCIYFFQWRGEDRGDIAPIGLKIQQYLFSVI